MEWSGEAGGLLPRERRSGLSHNYGGGVEGRGEWGEKQEARDLRGLQKMPLPFPPMGDRDAQCYISLRYPALVGLRLQAPSLGCAVVVPSVQGDQPSRPLRRRREPRGRRAQHPAPSGRSRGDGISCLPPRSGDGGVTDLETETGKKTQEEGAAERTRVSRRAGRMKEGEGAPTGREGPSRRGGRGTPGPGLARAHLVTVRRARGLCALSRPRRAPMPASTSSAATPHTA